jgi:dTMP kinase
MLNHYKQRVDPQMNPKGAFIVIEGLDGSGKTTQAKLLAANLKKSHGAVYTAEPSQGAIGKFIRNGILYGETRLPTTVEALLFAADRIEHIQNEVTPTLEKGRLVVSDRYIYSSLAYQGSAGLSLDWIQTINQHSMKPDLAIFIDVDPEVVLKRLKRRKSIMENLETQIRVREVYLKYVENCSLNRIDGDKPKRAVADAVLATVTAYLKTRS